MTQPDRPTNSVTMHTAPSVQPLSASPVVSVRPATTVDAAAIVGIYNHYVREAIATFEEEPITTAEMTQRMENVLSEARPWLVAEADGGIIGYAYGSRWKARAAYRYASEVTAYLHPDHCGRGIGSLLYERLLAELKDDGMHIAIGGISLPNEASVRLHEKLGFEKVAHFREVGFKFGRWIDVGYWQRSL